LNPTNHDSKEGGWKHFPRACGQPGKDFCQNQKSGFWGKKDLLGGGVPGGRSRNGSFLKITESPITKQYKVNWKRRRAPRAAKKEKLERFFHTEGRTEGGRVKVKGSRGVGTRKRRGGGTKNRKKKIETQEKREEKSKNT